MKESTLIKQGINKTALIFNYVKKRLNNKISYLSKNDLLLLFIPIFIFSILFIFINIPIAEDAYIIFRYSKNLVNTGEIVWNSGGPHSEGVTAFLWMIILANFYKIGLDIEKAAIFLNFIFSILTIILIYFISRKLLDSSEFSSFIAALAFAVSPIIIYTRTGFSTPLFTLLITLIFYFVLRYINNKNTYRSSREYLLLSILFLMVSLTRPEGVLISLTFWLLLIFLERNTTKRRELLFFPTLFYVLPGLIYFIWRWNYFGQLLPNPFYIKVGGFSFSRILFSSAHTFVFLSYILVPYLLMVILYLIIKDKKEEQLLLFPPFLFLLFYSFVYQIQNVAFRFQFPVTPVFLILFSKSLDYFIKKVKFKHLKSVSLHHLLFVFFVLILIFWPLPYTLNFKFSNNSLNDRFAIGKMLNEFKDYNYTIMLTEAGIIPYYSEWRTIDAIGLNDPYIARNGLSLDYIKRVDPDVILLQPKTEEVLNYLKGNIVPVFNKTKIFNEKTKLLYYYANRNNYNKIMVREGKGGDIIFVFIHTKLPHKEEISNLILQDTNAIIIN